MTDKTTTVIEWLVEFIDEDGDILEVCHCDSYAEALDWAARGEFLLARKFDVNIGLVRDRGNDLGGLIDRQWAYIEDDKLPERFSDSGGSEGPKVPAKYHNEMKRRMT